MFRNPFNRGRTDSRSRKRAAKPRLEGLEDRLVLYSTTGGLWSQTARITYSFVPDGTSVGGTPSALFQALDAKFTRSVWQAQFQKAAAIWQSVSKINLVLVGDNGAAIGSAGDQQGDSDFGDLRIGGIPQVSSQLGFAFLPPPFNGGTAAGDIFINTTANFQINNDFDLLTVAIHEFGHALGMGHSEVSTAQLYAAYNGMKQALTSDDTAGIRSIYSARQADSYDSGSGNNTSANASLITSLIDSNSQISISGLDITTSSDSDWFKVTVPANTSGTMVVKVQSSNLSSLSPRLQVYNNALVNIGTQSAPNTYGSTVSVTISGVTPGQVLYLKASAANTGPTGSGAYGLQVNFSSGVQDPIAPPNTTVAAQADQGGGTIGLGSSHPVEVVDTGTLSGFGEGIGVDPRLLDSDPTNDPLVSIRATQSTKSGGSSWFSTSAPVSSTNLNDYLQTAF